MNGFNENHKLRLRTTFRYVDELLTEVVRLLDGSVAQSPFSEHIADATPVQSRVICDYAARLRARMREILASEGIDLPERRISSIWAARTILSSIDIAVTEIRPKYMRGFGQLSESAVRALDQAAAQLEDLLARMEAYLAQGSGRDLQTRLQRLESTTDEARLLQNLSRIITARGLVELRPTLEMLVERLETPTFEVAVFGKVSSGKSSLLNYILKSQVLPVGVTPVTTIPTRIVHGPVARATIWFAEAPPITVEPSRLAEYVTEQHNPGNARHVSRIVVEAPSDCLKDGITFIDTPGVGSLARSGAAESLAYLPRCDLGIVLVDASSTLTDEDLAMADSLYRSSAQAMVLLSKGDVLAAADREPMVLYVRQQLQSNLGLDVPVHLVSVKGEDAKLCDQWFAESMVPALQQHRQLAADSLRCKIGALREAVVAALRKRQNRESPAVDAAKWEAARRAIASAMAQLDEARRHRPPSLEQPHALAEQVLDRVSSRAVTNWNQQQGDTAEITAIVTDEVDKAGRRLAGELIGELLALRRSQEEALSLAAGAVGATAQGQGSLPSPNGVPVLEHLAGIRLVVRRPVLRLPGRWASQRRVLKQARRCIHSQLVSMFQSYGRRLAEWRQSSLNDLRKAFTAQADVCRALAERANGEGIANDNSDDWSRDIASLIEAAPDAAAAG